MAIDKSWEKLVKAEWEKPYFLALSDFLKEEYAGKKIYPPKGLVFNAFTKPLDEVKVVIIGQDPYHGPGQAHGLSFSVNDGVAVPPSLKNMYKEIEADVGNKQPASGNLERWAKQGVLLLNNTLTVEAGRAGSHRGKGWEDFTAAMIGVLNEREGLVFMLWGRDARNKKVMLDASRHLILEAAHPSPLSAHNGFFGCKHFSKANAYLEERGKTPIEW
ncbi:uracil-DNA glycosylase [Candidatus Saccharibacteria bacterium]|nr:uracil-DNA glycosylase [Candidatus Saccharibacteria bacterium]